LRAPGERDPHLRPGGSPLPHRRTGEQVPPAPVRAFRLCGEPGFLHAEGGRNRRVSLGRARCGGSIPRSRVSRAPAGEPGVLLPHLGSLVPDLAELSPSRGPSSELEVLLIPPRVQGRLPRDAFSCRASPPDPRAVYAARG